MVSVYNIHRFFSERTIEVSTSKSVDINISRMVRTATSFWFYNYGVVRHFVSKCSNNPADFKSRQSFSFSEYGRPLPKLYSYNIMRSPVPVTRRSYICQYHLNSLENSYRSRSFALLMSSMKQWLSLALVMLRPLHVTVQ